MERASHKDTTKNKLEVDCRQQRLQGYQQDPKHFALRSWQILLRAWLVRSAGGSKRLRLEEVLNAYLNRKVQSLRKNFTDTASWVEYMTRTEGSGGFSSSVCLSSSSSMASLLRQINDLAAVEAKTGNEKL